MARRGARRERKARAQLDFWQKRLGAESKGVERVSVEGGGFELREGRSVKVTKAHLQDLAKEHGRNQMDYVLSVSGKRAEQGSKAHAAIFAKHSSPEDIFALADSAAKQGRPDAAAQILQSGVQAGALTKAHSDAFVKHAERSQTK